MAPTTTTTTKCDPTKILKYVSELLKQPSPKYTPTIPKAGGCLFYVKVMNKQYAGKIGGSLAEARASAARNALKKILKDNKDLKKDELVQEYLARSQDREEVHQVREPSVLCMKYVEALASMRDVEVGIIMKAMKKQRNKAECEKFLSMAVEERYIWLTTL